MDIFTLSLQNTVNVNNENIQQKSKEAANGISAQFITSSTM